MRLLSLRSEAVPEEGGLFHRCLCNFQIESVTQPTEFNTQRGLCQDPARTRRA